jgi:hypothetical protein
MAVVAMREVNRPSISCTGTPAGNSLQAAQHAHHHGVGGTGGPVAERVGHATIRQGCAGGKSSGVSVLKANGVEGRGNELERVGNGCPTPARSRWQEYGPSQKKEVKMPERLRITRPHSAPADVPIGVPAGSLASCPCCYRQNVMNQG